MSFNEETKVQILYRQFDEPEVFNNNLTYSGMEDFLIHKSKSSLLKTDHHNIHFMTALTKKPVLILFL